MTISFIGIPAGIRTPGSFVEYNNARAGGNALAVQKYKILVMGQVVTGGAGAMLTPTLMTGSNSAAAFGRGSMLDRMVKALYANNNTTEMWAMGVADNGAGVKATFTHTFTTSTTGAGSLPFYVGGTPVPVAFTSGMTVTQQATALAAAINANLDLPITATAAVGVVTSTCRWAGATGNAIDFRLAYEPGDVIPAGVTLATAAGTAGATNPDVTAAIAAMGDSHWNIIAFPWSDATNLGLMATELANRRGPLSMNEGIAFSSAKGSQGTLATLGEGMNSQDVSISECVGPVTPWERCAREAGVVAFYGNIDPARPFQTLALAGDIAPLAAERFIRAQRDALLHDGISTHTVDDGGNVLLERPITTYQTNGAGAADDSYLDVNTMLTLSYLRYTWRERMAQKFPRVKIADDDTVVAPGQNVVTISTLKAEYVALAQEWEAAGLVQDVDQFKAGLVVEINASDAGEVDSYLPPNLIPGLRVMAAQIDFAF